MLCGKEVLVKRAGKRKGLVEALPSPRFQRTTNRESQKQSVIGAIKTLYPGVLFLILKASKTGCDLHELLDS